MPIPTFSTEMTNESHILYRSDLGSSHELPEDTSLLYKPKKKQKNMSNENGLPESSEAK